MPESLGFTLAVVSLGALVPTYFGVAGEGWLSKVFEKGTTRAVSFGVILFLFLDLMELTAQLGIETQSRLTQLGLWLAFAAGLLILVGASGRTERWGGIAFLWALGLAFHSAGEGSIIAADYTSQALQVTVFQATSFASHKILEGFSLGSLRSSQHTSPMENVVLTLLAAGPSPLMFLAVVLGLPLGLVAYLFAAGAGASIFALARCLPSQREGFHPRLMILVLFGVLLMYLAGLLHEF